MRFRKWAVIVAAALVLGTWAATGATAQAASTMSCHTWAFDSGFEDSGYTGGLDGIGREASLVAGRYGKAVSLSGRTTSYVDLPNAVGALGTDRFELGFWINGRSPGRTHDIVGNRTQGSHGDFFSIRGDYRGAIIVELDEADGSTYTSLGSGSRPVLDASWHHVRVVRDGATTTLYIDGYYVSGARSRNGKTTDLRSTQPFRLGRTYSGSTSVAMKFDHMNLFRGDARYCAPGAEDDRYAGIEDRAITVSASSGVLRNDHGSTLTAQLTSSPSNGTLSLNTNGSFSYRPHANSCGTDTFTYFVTDRLGSKSDPATVSLSVRCMNDTPVAEPLELATDEDHAVSGRFIGSDVDGDRLTYAAAEAPAHGAVSVSGDSFLYTPDADFCGSDGFSYQADDGNQKSKPASVAISIACVNDTPVANPLELTTDEDQAVTAQASASDADGDDLAFELVTEPTNGTATIVETGLVEYSPQGDFCGDDAFDYAVSDGQTESIPATVSITVSCVNDAPVVDELALTTEEDHAVSGWITATDVDGDELTFTLAESASNGAVSVGENGLVSYMPEQDWFGTDSFIVLVDDGNGGTVESTVSVLVIEAPKVETSIEADAVATFGADPLSEGADLSARLTDVDGGALAGRVLVFSVGERTLCEAVTDADGIARCTPPEDGLADMAVDQGYDVTFDGGPDHLPATGRGTLA